MASSYESINGHDLVNEIEVSNINGALLMSLLEESHGDHDHNDERLISVIQSLEAEINPNPMEGHDLIMDQELLNMEEDGELCNIVAYMDGQDCFGPLDLDYGWIGLEPVLTSPSDDMRWYMESCENEMDGVDHEFGGVSEYSQIYHGFSLEEHGYNSLWNQTYDAVM